MKTGAIGIAGLAMLLALGGSAWASGASPTTSDDFIKALSLGGAPAAEPVIGQGGQPRKTRGLMLETGDTAEPAPATPAVTPASAPAKPAPQPAPQPAPKISFQVEFAFNSAELTPKAAGILNELGRALVSPELSAYHFRLTGHTDGVGNPGYNLSLSKRRAASVRDYLIKTFKVAPGRLDSLGLGSQQLLDPANPASDANRRVEIVNLGV